MERFAHFLGLHMELGTFLVKKTASVFEMFLVPTFSVLGTLFGTLWTGFLDHIGALFRSTDFEALLEPFGIAFGHPFDLKS